jgi:hypothetical protein
MSIDLRNSAQASKIFLWRESQFWLETAFLKESKSSSKDKRPCKGFFLPLAVRCILAARIRALRARLINNNNPYGEFKEID